MILFGLFWAQQSLYTAPSAHFALALFAKLNRWKKFGTKRICLLLYVSSLFRSLTHARPVCLSAVRFSFLSYEHKKFFLLHCWRKNISFRFVATAKMVESGWKANYLLICEVAFQILVVVYCICSFISVARQTHSNIILVVRENF